MPNDEHISAKQKNAARRKLQAAIKYGKVPRPDACQECGAADPQGHHTDYTKPLDVEWLCRDCHRSVHAGEHRHTGERRGVGRPLAPVRPNSEMEALRAVEARFQQAFAETEAAREARNEAVCAAVAEGWTHAQVAAVTDLTRARVGQIALAWRFAR